MDKLERLRLARAASAAKRAAGIQPERLDPIERARRNPTSLRLAINAKCWDCQGGDADPNPRQRIRDCEILSCPLHAVRPGRGGRGGEDLSDSAHETTEETEEEAVLCPYCGTYRLGEPEPPVDYCHHDRLPAPRRGS
jgi:hypothetical protein